MGNKDIAVLWEENSIQLDPANHNCVLKSTFQYVQNQNTAILMQGDSHSRIFPLTLNITYHNKKTNSTNQDVTTSRDEAKLIQIYTMRANSILQTSLTQA